MLKMDYCNYKIFFIKLFFFWFAVNYKYGVSTLVSDRASALKSVNSWQKC